LLEFSLLLYRFFKKIPIINYFIIDNGRVIFNTFNIKSLDIIVVNLKIVVSFNINIINLPKSLIIVKESSKFINNIDKVLN